MTHLCLTETTVVQFVEGSLPADRRPDVEAHVASCGTCSDLVTWAAADLRSGADPVAAPVEAPVTAARLAPLAAGAQVGRYQILGLVGRGGMGEVYAAYHPDLDRRIALKVVHDGGAGVEERQARLLREARSIARLQHPNVVAVYDAGTVADRVYVAMEFIEGPTLDVWMNAEPRARRQVMDVFLAAGRGLEAAHAAGIVHRDFKPQNVMIARDGSVRVMDFGLARMAVSEPTGPAPARDGLPANGQASANPTVTMAGTIVGTPAYMAPEQFRGEAVDARSDQFGFCVALYEALVGERPFRGDNLLSLSMNVADGAVRPTAAARRHELPVWIRKPLLRGLRPDPAQRHPTMAALIETLESDPAVKRRRLLGVGAIAAAVVASALFTWQTASRRWAAAEREIARQVDDATHAGADARAKAADAMALRRRAFDAFDGGDRKAGESLWRQARGLLPVVDADYDRAERSLETALALNPSRAQRRAALADLRVEHLLFAEDVRLTAKVSVLEERLAAVDADGSRRKALAAPGTLVVRATPAASRIQLERYERDPLAGRRRALPLGLMAAAPSEKSLAPGSYRLVLEGDGLARVVYPFELRRGERRVVELTLPRASTIPKGFVYVAPGPFWYGDADEPLRTQFLDAVPIHPRATGGYLIARYETTFQDWIAFLDDLPAAERARRTPAIKGTFRGGLSLSRGPNGWRIAIQPASRRYEAGLHEPIGYVGRSRRARQDWLRFPISGVSVGDVSRYLGWLRDTGRVPGARLCSELEWERAARGADDRLFPHGDELADDDANIDVTYERIDGAYGPDEIGQHPASRSPFEVDDLAGNIMEIVASDGPGAVVIRGGGYFFSAASARSTNHEQVPQSFRDVAVGLRACADAPGP